MHTPLKEFGIYLLKYELNGFMTFSSIEVLQLLECNDSEKKIQKLDRKYIYLIKLNIDIGSIKYFFLWLIGL